MNKMHTYYQTFLNSNKKKPEVKVKYLLFALVLFFANSVYCQHKKTKIFQNQIELGFNYTKQFNKRDIASGIGSLITTGNKYAQTGGLRWDYNRYLSYKAILFERHILKISYEDNGGEIDPFVPNFVGFWSYEMYLKSIGYGYILPTKYINISLLGHICHRTGIENVQFYNGNWNGQYIYNYLNSWLRYNSYGVKLGIDAEYFLNKNIGIGTNISYYYFPNEEAKLYGNDIETINPNMQKTYKPIGEFVNINFKIAYRFSLPKINFKRH